jgi:hypothetical protein
LLEQIIGDANLTEVLYLIWLGFVARGQRLPQSRRRFPQIAHTMLELLPPGSEIKSSRTSERRNQKEASCGVGLGGAALELPRSFA